MSHAPLFLATVAASSLLCTQARADGPADVATPPPPPSAITGGQDATVCAWPTTVSTAGGGCTGTLVHPQIVTYAAHCGSGANSVRFGETAWGGSGTNVSVDMCRTNPDYSGDVSDVEDDCAFCRLAQPVSLPVSPPLYGCEIDELEPGAEVAIVGFGEPGSGRKSWAMTYVNNVTPGQISIGGNGVGPCPGDSGGPAFLQLDDGMWRAFGIVSTGTGCGQAANYSRIDNCVEWIEATSGVDITPCFASDGTWTPTQDCGGFITSGEQGYGTWNNFCDGTPAGDYSATCGAPFGADPDEDPPTVTITAPMDGEEFADAPQTLTVELDAEDGDGWGVKHVWLNIDGSDVDVFDTEAPYGFEGVNFPEGVHEIIGKAEDLAGNVGESEMVTIGVGVELPDDDTDSGGSGDTGDGGSGDGTGSGADDGQDDGSDDGGDGGSDGATGGDDGSADDSSDGCGCTSRRNLTPPAMAVLLVVLAAARRRSRRA